MNKNHVTRKAEISPVATCGARQSVLAAEAESPRMPRAFDDASDWPEQDGDDSAYLGSGDSEQSDDALAPEVESGINLLLHGVPCR